MSSVLSDAVVKCRKTKTCDQCGRRIDVGEKYRKQVYADGNIFTYRAHEDCDSAASLYADLACLDLSYDDPPILQNDICNEDGEWLWAEFPRVADRLGVAQLSWAHRFVRWRCA